MSLRRLVRSRGGTLALAFVVVACGVTRAPESAPGAGPSAPIVVQSATPPAATAALDAPSGAAASVAGNATSTAADVLNDGVTPGKTGQMPGPGVPANPTLLWRTRVGGAVDASPIVAGSQVLVGANNGTLYDLDLNTGATNWTLPLRGPVRRGAVAVDRGTIFVSTGDNVLHAISLDVHQELWIVQGITAEAIPAVVGDLVLVGSQDHALLALDRATGAERWRVPVVGNARTMAVAGGMAYVSGELDGQLYAVDTRSGSIAWTFQTGANGVQIPAVIDGMVFANAQDDPGRNARIVALDARTGAELWRYATPDGVMMGRMAVDATRVYTETWAATPTALALDRSTGKLLWQSPIEATGAPSVSGSVVYESAATGGVTRAFDAATGAVLWSFTSGRSVRAPQLAVSQGTIVFGTGSDAFGPGSVGAIVVAGDPRLALVAAGPPSASPVPVPVTYVKEFQADNRVSLYLALAMDPAGNVWVTDNLNDRLLEFDPDGRLLRSIGSHGDKLGQFFFCEQPCASGGGSVAFASDGSFVVADGNNHRIQQFDAQGNAIAQFGRFGRGAGQFINGAYVGIDSIGQIYVVDTSRADVQVFTATGVYIRTIGKAGSGPGEFYVPGPPAFNSAGNLFVPDYGSHRVEEFFANGGASTSITGDADKTIFFGGVQSVTRGPHDNLYVIDDTIGLIVLDPNGKLLAAVGTTIDGHDDLVPLNIGFGKDGRAYMPNVGVSGSASADDDVIEIELLPPLYP